MQKEFRAIRFHEYGSSDKLVLETLPMPALKANEVLVEVSYAGVNPIDWKIRAGYLKDFMPVTLPYAPGIDLSGIVAETGPDVKNLAKGQAVFGIAKGAYAEYAVAYESDLHPKPEGLSFELAATVPVAALTAWKALDDSEAKAGQTVVVQGAAGGVGLFGVQFAKLRGAKVVAVASGGNAAFVKSLGADSVVDYRQGPLGESIEKADVVLDFVGGEALEKAYGLLKKGGVLVTVAGRVSEDKAREMGVKALSSGRGPAALLEPIAELLADGRVRSEVGRIFPLAEASAAQDFSQVGHGRGHALIKIR